MTNLATHLNTDRASLMGEHCKAAGRNQAENSKASLLELARHLARRAALERADRTVTADDVQEALANEGVSERALGNAAGSLFRGRDWEWTGRRVKSRRPHAHANEIKVWRYVGDKPASADTAGNIDVYGDGRAMPTASNDRRSATANTLRGEALPGVANQQLLFSLPVELPD